MDEIVRDFVNKVDSNVDDLGYDIKGIIKEYSGYKFGINDTRDFFDFMVLATTLYRKGLVKNEQDATFIAQVAADRLYPQITNLLKGMGYIAAVVHDVKFKMIRSSRSIMCDLMLMVV